MFAVRFHVLVSFSIVGVALNHQKKEEKRTQKKNIKNHKTHAYFWFGLMRCLAGYLKSL